MCHEIGSIPKRNRSHEFVSFHNARFIREDLLSEPVESPAGHTQRGGDYGIEISRASTGHEVPVRGGSADGEEGVGLKPDGYSGIGPVEWKSSRTTSNGQSEL